MWDPGTYLRYADERSRPFFDLLSRVELADPQTIVDLGCGPGTLTAHLAQRWPGAAVVGLDSSPEMIAAAQRLGAPVRFAVADATDWHATADVGLVVANAGVARANSSASRRSATTIATRRPRAPATPR